MREFSNAELLIATGNYDENRILGTGGFGTVYSGRLAALPDQEIAVKRIQLNTQVKNK